jgi:hypothetical protein
MAEDRSGGGQVPVDSQYYQAEQAEGSAPPEAQNSARDAPSETPREAPKEAPTDTSREVDGRWQKGASGNPAGRPRGARNEATRRAEQLLDFYAAQLTAEAIRQALKGDSVALRFCLARIVAPRRTPAVAFELPQVDSAADLVGAMSAVTAATADGTLAPSEAGELARLLETSLRMIEARRHHAQEEERPAAESGAASP